MVGANDFRKNRPLKAKGGGVGDIRPLSLKGIAFYVSEAPKIVGSPTSCSVKFLSGNLGSWGFKKW